MSKPLGQRNYETFARRYAEYAPTKGHNGYYEWPATRSLIGLIDGLHVLDAGCGPGYLTRWLADRGAVVTGIDVTPEFVQITRERLGDDATVLSGDLNRPLDFADATFDRVVCALVLDYLKDWRPIFAEFARVLRPGGELVFSCGHPTADFELWRQRVSADTDYFAVELGAFPWGGFGDPQPVVESYRRPLQEVLNPLIEAGFCLDRILEPKPIPEFAAADAETYQHLMHAPGFLCVRAALPRT